MNFALGLMSGWISVMGTFLVIVGMGRHVGGGRQALDQLAAHGFLLLHVLLIAAHFAVPLSGWPVRILVGATAVGGLYRGRALLLRSTRSWLSLAGASLVVASASVVPVTNYDSAFYYHSMIAHLRGDQVVIGLANLHFRLGNWSGSLSLAAFLENGPWGGDGYRLANALVILLASAVVAPKAIRVVGGRSSAGDLIAVVALPLCLAEFGRSLGFFVAAPTPDTGFSLMAVLAISALVDVVTESNPSSYSDLAIWATLALIYRPTGLVFVVVGSALLALAFLRSRVVLSRRLAVLAALGVLGHLLMTTLITGFPVFPVVGLPEVTSWSVPKGIRAHHVSMISTIAREAGQPVFGPGAWSWLAPWLARNNRFLLETVSLLFAGLTLLIVTRARGVVRQLSLALGVTTPVVILWFWAAPDPRFGHGLVLAWAAIPLALACGGNCETALSRRRGVAFVGAALLAGVVTMAVGFREQVLGNSLGDLSHVGTAKQVILESNGLTFTRPRSDPGCGSAVWCTPEQISGLSVDQWGPFTVLSRE